MKGRRRHISWKTKCAAAVLDAMLQRERFGLYPQRWYDDAKIMTEDQFLSLFHWDHNILHETGHEYRNQYWNLAPMLIREHREKTKTDARVIAKGRRIRRKDSAGAAHDPRLGPAPPLRIGPDEARGEHSRRTSIPPLSGPHKRKIRSRGFDKTRRRKMDGTVTKRER